MRVVTRLRTELEVVAFFRSAQALEKALVIRLEPARIGIEHKLRVGIALHLVHTFAVCHHTLVTV